jgi:hypothetical protein
MKSEVSSSVVYFIMVGLAYDDQTINDSVLFLIKIKYNGQTLTMASSKYIPKVGEQPFGSYVPKSPLSTILGANKMFR